MCTKINDVSEVTETLRIGKSQGKLYILTVNIRSIHSNFDKLAIFLTSLKSHVEIIVLTECWINKSSLIPNMPGYHSFFTKNTLNQNDGIIIYVKENLNIKCYEPHVEEGTCLSIAIPQIDCYIITSYRSPSYRNPNKYVNSLDKLLESVHARNIILTGDININIMSGSVSACSQEYLDMLSSHGLAQGINIPTRQNSCIDHFMVKSSNKWQTFVFEELTDHCPILLETENIINLFNQKPAHFKQSINFENIGKALENVSWDVYFATSDANEACNLLIKTLSTIINNNKSLVQISNKFRPIKPWITPGMLKSIRKRNKLYKQYKNNPNNNDFHMKYIQYRNKCNYLIKFLKQQYYDTQLKIKCNNTRDTWKLIKEIGNMNSEFTSAKELLAICNNKQNSLNTVNKYFTSIGAKLASNTLARLQTSELELARKVSMQPGTKNSMFLIPSDHEELNNVISKLKICSPGVDDISALIIKRFKQLLIAPILHLCNLSLETGIFPTSLKHSVVIPIHKKGDKRDCSNYRPISLLSTLSKILEKLFNKRLISYIDSQKLLADNQYGFRSKKSTEDAVLNLTSLITHYVDKGEKCVGIFLDLQKAFDTVSIPILIARLENIGIRGTPLNWLKNYLSDRKQRVRIDNLDSVSYACNFGIPQGSTIGPTLFLIYINQLSLLLKDKADVLMFADDTVLLMHSETWEKVKECAEKGLSVVTTWLEDNLLNVNVEKTKYISFTNTRISNPPNDLKIKIHTYPCNRDIANFSKGCSCPILANTSHIKYLGVTLDEHLSWKQHIADITSRTRKLIPVFKNLRNILNVALVINTYKSLAQCLLSYCITSWGGAAKTHLLVLERAQRVLLKVCLKLPYRYPTHNLYETANVLSVRKLFIFLCIKKYHQTVISTQQTNGKRRQTCPLPLVRSAVATRHFNFLAPHLYNCMEKQYPIRKCNVFQVKKYAVDWLKGYDYNQTEVIIRN